MTCRAIATVALSAIGFVAPASSQSASILIERTRPILALDSYTTSDGAITVFAGGSYVEPYFAMRALNTAADLGVDVDSLARGYIRWQLAQLDAGTSFKRYCRGRDGTWSACGVADADDAALALWIELLFRVAGRTAMPVTWRRSAEGARRALAALWDPAVGVYLVSSSVKAGLLMDNIEVLSALETAARTPAAAAGGDRIPLSRGAARLRNGITRVFWDRATATYRVSTQPPEPIPRFYPEIVAQLFPAAFGYGNPAKSSKTLVAQWLRQHERNWVAASDSGAAWGLVAVAALRTRHFAAAACWRDRAEALRAGAGWNVTDEAVFVILGSEATKDPCPGGGAVSPRHTGVLRRSAPQNDRQRKR